MMKERFPSHRKEMAKAPALKPEVKGAPEIKRDEIEEGALVGSGQYGDVYRGRCRGYEVAIKILKDRFGSEEQMASFKREVEIMSRIRFPNVCLLLGACTDPDYFCIVQEYLPGGDLASLLEKGRLSSSFYGRMRLASQVARGLLWIHSNGVLHRDLKLENLLLDTHGEVKVCDFGLADNTGGMKFIWDEKGRKGSPLYMAPEVLQKKALNNKVDVYSFGLILWEVLSGKRAFQEHLKHNDLAIFTSAICEKMERPAIPPEKGSKEEGWNNVYVTNLIKRCWSDKPKDRPDFQEIYDELNVLITEGYIKDDWGRTFWLINFPDQDSVPWEEFIKILMCKKTVPLDDGTTFNKGLSMSKKDPDNSKKALCLKLLLAQISGQKNSTFSRVTCENFGKVLAWFGPGIDNDPKAQHKNFLERVAYIARQPWFFGSIDKPDLLLHDGNKPVYMIRLSNEPGYFTIHTTKMKTRIIYTPGVGYKPEGDKEVFPDLVVFAKSKLQAYDAQTGSDYAAIFGEIAQANTGLGAYLAYNFLQNAQDDDPSKSKKH
jgi:serine/threonine protein kinase